MANRHIPSKQLAYFRVRKIRVYYPEIFICTDIIKKKSYKVRDIF